MKNFKTFLVESETRKAKFQPGDKVELHSTPFTGQDGKTYHVHGFYGHHLATPEPSTLSGTYVKKNGNYHEVQLDQHSLNTKVQGFVKTTHASRMHGKPIDHLQADSWTDKNDLEPLKKKNYSAGHHGSPVLAKRVHKVKE